MSVNYNQAIASIAQKIHVLAALQKYIGVCANLHETIRTTYPKDTTIPVPASVKDVDKLTKDPHHHSSLLMHDLHMELKSVFGCKKMSMNIGSEFYITFDGHVIEDGTLVFIENQLTECFQFGMRFESPPAKKQKVVYESDDEISCGTVLPTETSSKPKFITYDHTE